MTDLLLKHTFTDRAGRGVYEVWRTLDCPTCKRTHSDVFTGQKIRFDLDGDHNIKVDSIRLD
jgi:hypothetical protein